MNQYKDPNKHVTQQRPQSRGAKRAGYAALALAVGATGGALGVGLNILKNVTEVNPGTVSEFLAKYNQSNDPNKIPGFENVTIKAVTGAINERSFPEINGPDGSPLDNIYGTIPQGDTLVAKFAAPVISESANSNVSQSDTWLAIPNKNGFVYVDVSEAIREGDVVTVGDGGSPLEPTNTSASIKDSTIYFNGSPVSSPQIQATS